jgi:hypothetical protein
VRREEPAAAAQHARALGQRARRVADRVQRRHEDHVVDRAGGDRQGQRIGAGDALPDAGAGPGQHRRGQVDPGHGVPPLEQRECDQAGADADLEDGAGHQPRGEVVGRAAAALLAAAGLVVPVGDPVERHRCGHGR